MNIKKLWSRLLSMFSRRKEPEYLSGKQKQKLPRQSDDGSFYFREDILARLPNIHRELEMLKKSDPEAYDFHSKYGARIVPKSSKYRGFNIDSASSAGMVYMRGGHNEETVWPSFVYFKEYKEPYRCKPSNGRIFAVYASYHLDGRASVVEFFVSLAGDAFSLCRTLQTSRKVIPSRNGRGKGKIKYISLPTQKWGYDTNLISIARENEATPEDVARELFGTAINSWSAATDSGLVVRCSDGKTVATFNIDTKRTPYFFKDRITALASDGKRKRIFHSVTKHKRDLGDGRESVVKAHYRGERKFQWGNDNVSVTVPGLHYKKGWAIFTPKAEVFEKDDDTTGYLDSREVGAKLAQVLDR